MVVSLTRVAMNAKFAANGACLVPKNFLCELGDTWLMNHTGHGNRHCQHPHSKKLSLVAPYVLILLKRSGTSSAPACGAILCAATCGGRHDLRATQLRVDHGADQARAGMP